MDARGDLLFRAVLLRGPVLLPGRAWATISFSMARRSKTRVTSRDGQGNHWSPDTRLAKGYAGKLFL